jgi:hypothetical protein
MKIEFPFSWISGCKNLWCALLMPLCYASFAQTSSKSLLLNHGSTCGGTVAEQNFFTGATTGSPGLISTGNVGLPFYDVLTAYNPEDHNVYYANMTPTNTYIYVVDYNLNGGLTSPAAAAPTYTYNYTLNQLCFDNNGDNYVFSNFDAPTGTATLNRIDITTGVEIAGTNKKVTFPAGNIPNTLAWGDMIVLPNGRMFVTFGYAPSKLYEINNSEGPGRGTAVFLADLPRVCFSMAYTDGNIIIAGSDGNGCYYYTWDINSLALSTMYAYPYGKSSADMSSITAGTGVANRLLGATMASGNSAVLYYEIVLKNKGNIALNNLQLTNNLAQTFGTTSITGVRVMATSNPANLLLNPAYDGVNDTNLLMPGQMLNNFPLQQDSLIIRLQFTASDLIAGQVYKNSVFSSGQFGWAQAPIVVTDSSNNGTWSRIDIDRNGVSDDAGENVPTPFVFGSVLALEPVNLKGGKNKNTIQLNWESTIDRDVTAYEVERSVDGRHFQSISFVKAVAKNQYSLDDNFTVLHRFLYYRIKAHKQNQNIVYSNMLILNGNETPSSTISLFPNPFQSVATVEAYVPVKTNAEITLLDVTGKTVWRHAQSLEAGNNRFALSGLTKVKPGQYWLSINTGNSRNLMSVMKR